MKRIRPVASKAIEAKEVKANETKAEVVGNFKIDDEVESILVKAHGNVGLTHFMFNVLYRTCNDVFYTAASVEQRKLLDQWFDAAEASEQQLEAYNADIHGDDHFKDKAFKDAEELLKFMADINEAILRSTVEVAGEVSLLIMSGILVNKNLEDVLKVYPDLSDLPARAKTLDETKAKKIAEILEIYKSDRDAGLKAFSDYAMSIKKAKEAEIAKELNDDDKQSLKELVNTPVEELVEKINEKTMSEVERVNAFVEDTMKKVEENKPSTPSSSNSSSISLGELAIGAVVLGAAAFGAFKAYSYFSNKGDDIIVIDTNDLDAQLEVMDYNDL